MIVFFAIFALLAVQIDAFRVDPSEIVGGGPPPDGIPPIENPKFESLSQTLFSSDDEVILVRSDQEIKAYPILILNKHEIVNDEIGEVPITISYCPLCHTTVVFRRTLEDGQETTFGTSGKLYQSCLVMYDRATNSLWSHPCATAIGGPLTDQQLTRLTRVTLTTIRQLRRTHPDAKILSTDTGFSRDYKRYPYGDYRSSEGIKFPAKSQQLRRSDGHGAKEIGAYIFENSNDQSGQGKFTGNSLFLTDREMKSAKTKFLNFNGETVLARWDRKYGSIRFYKFARVSNRRSRNAREMPSSSAFAFAYYAIFK